MSTHVSILVRLSQENDSTAWYEFQERYGELIRRFASRQGLQPVDCDDVLQDVLLALTRAMPGFVYDPARGKFRSFLKTVALRATFKKKFQNRRGVPREHIEEASRAAGNDETVERYWETEWRDYHIRRAMKSVEVEFSSSDRNAFERYAIAHEDARRVADDLELSVDQVYQAKSRIMKRLAHLIDQQVKEEG